MSQSSCPQAQKGVPIPAPKPDLIANITLPLLEVSLKCAELQISLASAVLAAVALASSMLAFTSQYRI